MFSIVITEKGGAQQQLDLDAAEIGIGRLEDNEICLPKNNVSKHHARLVFKDSRYVVVDQKSTNGTYVNGRRISGPTVVRRGDKIYIGDFILTLGAGALESVAARDFSPLPPPPQRNSEAPFQTTVPTQMPAMSMAPELKRTQPERRSASERATARKAVSGGPPPLPRSVNPPPLPRSSPTPGSVPLVDVTASQPSAANQTRPAAPLDPNERTDMGMNEPLSE
ncbi:MAG: FHA domain-containing protein, partial [Polyangiales bacterium]